MTKTSKKGSAHVEEDESTTRDPHWEWQDTDALVDFVVTERKTRQKILHTFHHDRQRILHITNHNKLRTHFSNMNMKKSSVQKPFKRTLMKRSNAERKSLMKEQITARE